MTQRLTTETTDCDDTHPTRGHWRWRRQRKSTFLRHFYLPLHSIYTCTVYCTIQSNGRLPFSHTPHITTKSIKIVGAHSESILHHTMASHVTRAVRFFSSVHSSVGAIRSGNLHPVTAFKNTFFTPTRFPYVLGVLAIGSFTLGWRGMDHVRDESVSDCFAFVCFPTSCRCQAAHHIPDS